MEEREDKKKRRNWPPSKKDASGQRLKLEFDLLSRAREVEPPQSKELTSLVSRIFKAEIGDRWGIFKQVKDRNDEFVAEAFKASGLDENNPLHLKVLLGLLCRVHFGYSDSGRPGKDPLVFFVVIADVLSIEKKYKIENDDKKVAELLRRHMNDKYGSYELASLVKYIKKARKKTFEMSYPFHEAPYANLYLSRAATEGRKVPLSVREVAVAVDRNIFQQSLSVQKAAPKAEEGEPG